MMQINEWYKTGIVSEQKYFTAKNFFNEIILVIKKKFEEIFLWSGFKWSEKCKMEWIIFYGTSKINFKIAMFVLHYQNESKFH